MGGGGFLGLGPAPSAPAAPDYTAAANATAAGNLDAARAATAARNEGTIITHFIPPEFTVRTQHPAGQEKSSW